MDDNNEATKCKGSHVVLVVDDDPIIRNLMMRTLQGKGFEVDLAEDGLAAIRRFQGRTYDLVVMDVQMPNMNGLQAAAVMRTIEENAQAVKQIPIVAVTAGGASEAVCIAAGMSDFFEKPLDSNKLDFVLRKWLP